MLRCYYLEDFEFRKMKRDSTAVYVNGFKLLFKTMEYLLKKVKF